MGVTSYTPLTYIHIVTPVVLGVGEVTVTDGGESLTDEDVIIVETAQPYHPTVDHYPPLTVVHFGFTTPVCTVYMAIPADTAAVDVSAVVMDDGTILVFDGGEEITW